MRIVRKSERSYDPFVAQVIFSYGDWIYPYQILESSLMVNGAQKYLGRISTKNLNSSLRRLSKEGVITYRQINRKRSYRFLDANL